MTRVFLEDPATGAQVGKTAESRNPIRVARVAGGTILVQLDVSSGDDAFDSVEAEAVLRKVLDSRKLSPTETAAPGKVAEKASAFSVWAYRDIA